MHQHIKSAASVAIKPFGKQKRKRYNGWPLVKDPGGGSHEWLMRACEREGTPAGAEL